MITPEDVLDFWFGSKNGTESDRMKLWFHKSDETDRKIEAKFGETVEQAVLGRLDDWADEPRSRLALVIVLDQFTRNIYRDTPRAFMGDVIACPLALDAIAKGFDDEVSPDEAVFYYMPLEHQEDIRLQEQCIELMEKTVARVDESRQEHFRAFLSYAESHRDVIAKHGRFPHRNSILNRPNTPAEEDYLAQPGAGF